MFLDKMTDDLDKIVQKPHPLAVVGKMGVKGGLEVAKVTGYAFTAALLPADLQNEIDYKYQKAGWGINLAVQPFVTAGITYGITGSIDYGIKAAIAEGAVSFFRLCIFVDKGRPLGHPVVSLLAILGTGVVVEGVGAGKAISNYFSKKYSETQDEMITDRKKKLTAQQAEGALSLSERTETGNLAIAETQGGLSYPENDR